MNHVLSPISQPTLDVTPIWMPCHWKEVRKLQNSQHSVALFIWLSSLNACFSHQAMQFYEIQVVVVLERHDDFISGHTF